MLFICEKMLSNPTKTLKCSSIGLLVVLTVFESVFSSLLPYDFENNEDVEIVVFTSEDDGSGLLGQLYLQGPSPEINIQLRYRDNDTKYNRNGLVNHYSSQGIHPTMMIFNASWNASLELDEVAQTKDTLYWRRNITISNLFYQENKYSLRRYDFIAELGKGLNLFEHRGSLIIKEAEPLLDLQFGDLVDSVSVNAEELIIRNTPCSAVVAGLVPISNASENQNSGYYFGVTYNYFSSSSMKWFNLLNPSSGTPDKHSLCNQSSFSDCTDLSILDFALMRDYLVFVTTHGIAVSQSFQEASKNGSGSKITFTKVQSAHRIIDRAVTTSSLTRSNVKLFYTSYCYSDFVSDGREEVCIVYNNNTANDILVLCAVPPYNEWLKQDFNNLSGGSLVDNLVHDIQRETKVLLVIDTLKGSSFIQVYKGSSKIFPMFRFGEPDIVKSLHYHLHTGTIFAYGSQVWQSLDGGNSFHRVSSFQNQQIRSFAVDLFGEVFSVVTNSGTILVGKVGIHRTAVLKTNVTLSHVVNSQVVTDSDSLVLLKVNSSSSLSIGHDVFNLKLSSDIKEEIQSTLLVNFKSETRVEFLLDCECFSTSNIGQILHSKYGGFAIITHIQEAPSFISSVFKQHVFGYVLKPFNEVESNSIAKIKVDWSGWNASLTLLNGVWEEDDVGQTVVLPNGQSFLLVHRLSPSKASCLSFLPWTYNDPYHGVHEGWSLYDFRDSISSEKAWWLKEDTCKSILIEATHSTPQFYHLDSTDSLELTATVVSKKTVHKPIPRVLISHPGLFTTTSVYEMSHLNTTLKITIKQRPLASGTSPVTVVLENASLFCRRTSLTATIHSGCPPSKTLRCIHPSISADRVHSYNLPYNYRPPSVRGKAIPMTSHIYNVDPLKPHYRSAYAITRETVRYKQCLNVGTRAGCGCTRALRRSTLIEHSDCIDAAYRLSFSEMLRPKFLISRTGRGTESLKSPFYLEELNHRVDYVILNPSNKTVMETTAIIMEERINSSIEFMGSGLYHFRAHPVRENYTFCGLTAEFVVFIVETPLPYPVKDIVMACTAMGFSAMLYVIYLTYFHGKKKIKYD